MKKPKLIATVLVSVMVFTGAGALPQTGQTMSREENVVSIAEMLQKGKTHAEVLRAKYDEQVLQEKLTRYPGPQNLSKGKELLEEQIAKTEERQSFLIKETERHTRKHGDKKKAQKIKEETIESDTYIIDEPPRGAGYQGGSYGYLEIPDVGLQVCVNWAEKYTSQAVLDPWNSAAYMNFWGIPVIGDHSNQEFGPLRNVYSGMTANIWRPDGSVETYVCRSAFVGTNTGYDLVDGNGNSCLYASGSLMMYTCMSSSTWTSVYITIWDRT